MAWGNFLNIPCPVKKWDEKLNKLMLTMLPAIGLIAGLVLFGVALLLNMAPIPVIIKGFILTFFLYHISGFIHLDGFMDCADAVLSRRDLEERRRILKDSSVGAFAVISLVLLVLGTFTALTGLEESIGGAGDLLVLILVPVVSRGISGACVLQYKPLSTSQYSETRGSKKGVFVIAIQLAIVLVVIIAVFCNTEKSIYVAVFGAGVTAIATGMTAYLCSRNLEGMNGDIAGCAISMGEFAGFMAAAVVAAVM